MHHRWKRFVLCSLCLATLLFASGPPLTSSAATRTPRLPPHPRTCDVRNNAYPPNFAAPTQLSSWPGEDITYDPTAPYYQPTYAAVYYEAGGTYSTSELSVGAWTCGSNFLELIVVNGGLYSFVPDSYFITLTANGMSTFMQLAPSAFSSPDPTTGYGMPTTELTVQAHQVYTIDVGACQNTFCEEEVELQVVTATDPYCQNGYVWRDIFPQDHVCVQPWEAAQADQDNGETQSRQDWAYPNYCYSGYVWREAYPWDHVCVDPAQRQQAYDDNSQALNRIVAL